MKLSQEQINMFNTLCENRTVFIITGFNDFGQEFETAARITHDDSNKPGIYDTCIFFEFGNQPSKVAPQRTDIFGAFLTDYTSENSVGNSLIIDKIMLENGQVLFENPDSEKYYKTAKLNAEKYNKQNEAEGRNLTKLDPVTAKLPEMIGKPIIVDGIRRGVLINASRVANNGSVIMEFLDGPGMSNSFVNEDTRITTTDLDGKIYIVEVNGKTQEEFDSIQKIFAERVNRIAELENAKGLQ